MISFESYPPPPNYRNHSYRDEDDMDINLDGEDVTPTSRVTCPGDDLTSAQVFMRGHGTYVDNEKIVSSVAGTIETVNKLISVRSLGTRYNPEVGDLVVGRIAEVQLRRWKVDANSRQDAILMLSSVNLPGGVQRRKLESDELEMRNFFEEGDLLVAEVQSLYGDGTMSLHTRSLSYGKLRNGQLVTAPPALIRRLKSHFITLPCGVDLILGLNGYIWVSKHLKQNREGEDAFDAEAVYSNQNEDIDNPTRVAIVRVTNIIRAFATRFMPLTDTLLLEAYDWVVEHQNSDVGGIEEEMVEAMVSALVVRA